MYDPNIPIDLLYDLLQNTFPRYDVGDTSQSKHGYKYVGYEILSRTLTRKDARRIWRHYA